MGASRSIFPPSDHCWRDLGVNLLSAEVGWTIRIQVMRLAQARLKIGGRIETVEEILIGHLVQPSRTPRRSW
jgi:hypothetical protein